MADIDQPSQPRGEIYDLGYRHYEGPRLGRGYAIRSLMVLSVRNTFGLGRGALPKVLAFGLAAIAMLPAIGTVIVGAVAGSDFEFVKYEDYFGLIQVVIVLFVAAMASDLVGNDRKNNTLPLYFSRPIERDDYVLAKIAALALALLALTLVPQLLVFIGNWLGASDSAGWLADNGADLVRIIASATLVSLQLATIGLSIAIFTTRRAFAMISVLAALLISFIAASILVSLLDPGWAGITMVLSPLHVMNAATFVIFDALPAVTAESPEGEVADQVAYGDLPAIAWIGALAAQTGLALLVTLRRYRSAAL